MTYQAHSGMFSALALALLCSLAGGGAFLSVHSIPTADTRPAQGLPALPAGLAAGTAPEEGVPTKPPALPGGARSPRSRPPPSPSTT